MYDSINDFDVLAKNSRNITAILKTELPSVIDRNTVKNLNKAIFYGIELKEFDILPGLKAEDPTAEQQYCYCCKLRRVPAADL